jgi:hypothetical protein
VICPVLSEVSQKGLNCIYCGDFAVCLKSWYGAHYFNGTFSIILSLNPEMFILLFFNIWSFAILFCSERFNEDSRSYWNYSYVLKR